MARKGAVVKGVKGFAKHPVVAISPNGEAKHFDSTTALRRQRALRAWQNKTEEEKQKKREWGREHVRKMRAEGKWSTGHKPVPVYCLTLKKYFPSITDAAKELGVSLSAICQAVKMNRPVRGLKFYRKSVWDKITQKKS